MKHSVRNFPGKKSPIYKIMIFGSVPQAHLGQGFIEKSVKEVDPLLHGGRQLRIQHLQIAIDDCVVEKLAVRQAAPRTKEKQMSGPLRVHGSKSPPSACVAPLGPLDEFLPCVISHSQCVPMPVGIGLRIAQISSRSCRWWFGLAAGRAAVKSLGPASREGTSKPVCQNTKSHCQIPDAY